MENILAIVVVLGMVGVFWFVLSRTIKYRAEKAQAIEDRQEIIRKHMSKITEENNQRAVSLSNAIKNTAKVPAKKPVVKVEPAKPSYAPSPTQSMESYQASRSMLDDVADVAMIASVIHHWNDKPHHTNTDNPIDFPKEERSVGVSKSESSWGFDDSDSRKSISSSMDTYSSSDSYSSSSSDSGPSSDW